MSEVRVDRKLIFKGSAATTDNVEGNPSNKKLVECDDFNQVAIDNTNDYTVTIDNTNDAVEINTTPGSGGWVGMLGPDEDNGVAYFAGALIFDISKNPVIEARVKLAVVADTSFFFGFSDAVTESTPASTIDYADGSLAAEATDAVGFVCDGDKIITTYPPIYAASVKTAGGVAAAVTGTEWQDNAVYVLRIELKSDGDAHFFIDGALTNIVQAAVTDVPLCAMFNDGTREGGGGEYIYIDYLKYWQDR